MSNSASFNAIFTVNVNSEQEFSEWMKNFQKTSDTQFNIHKTYVCDGRYVVFKKTYKCHHNVNRGVLGRHKHTSCNAKATVTIRHCPKRIRKDRTKVHPDGLCLIDLTWDHNHPLSAADVVRHYSVSPETNEQLLQLFRNGHSPSSALECVRMELEDEVTDSETLEQLLANRSICPDYRHCHYLFTKEFKEQYGDPHDNDKLQEFCDRVNRVMGDMCVKVEVCNSVYIVAICTPVMKRIHQHIQESGELVFVDSSGRDVNKDLAPKDKDKDLTPKDQDKGKDLTPKDQDKDKDLTPKDKDKDKDLTPKDQDKDKDLKYVLKDKDEDKDHS